MPVRPPLPFRRPSAAVAALLAAGLLLTSCGSGGGASSSASGAEGPDCIEDFDPEKDYFPHKSKVEHADNFTLRYEKSYQVLTVEEPYPKADPESYVLVKCGAPKPELTGKLAKAQRITTPVKSLYSASTTHLPLLAETGTLDRLTGVANGSFVTSPEVRKRVKAKKIAEYAEDDSADAEKVIGADPDVLMTAGTDDPQYAKLRKAGIAVVANAEWLEGSPLGRAEWVKAMAALTGAEEKAGAVFGKVEKDYRAVAEKAEKASAEDGRTDVLAGSMLQGKWSMAAGDSYSGKLLKDAGGTHPWNGTKGTGNLELGFESVYAKAGDAPVWLVGDPWRTTADAVEADSRYEELKAVRDGEVWSSTRAVTSSGGNDYFERGVLHPDLILADLFAVLHPEEAKGHEFTFYKKVPKA